MRLFGVVAGVLAVVALAVAAGAGAFGGTNPRVGNGAPAPPSSAELQTLGRYAVRAAALAGDPHPTAAFVVPTTRRIAEQVAAGEGSGLPNTPVYFVVLQGRFTLNVSVPSGSREPTGTVYTLVVDPRRNVSLDIGAGNRMPDLFAIGEPEPLPLPATVG